MKMTITWLRRLLISAMILLVLYPLFVFAKFKYFETHTDINTAMNDSQHLTIIYRQGCSRCEKTLPLVLLKHGFDTKWVNVINAKKLDRTELDELDIRITPVFRLDKVSENTTNPKIIKQIFLQSK